MSKADFADRNDEIDPDDALEQIEENRDLYERIAAADLSVSEYYEQALERVDEEVDDGE